MYYKHDAITSLKLNNFIIYILNAQSLKKSYKLTRFINN